MDEWTAAKKKLLFLIELAERDLEGLRKVPTTGQPYVQNHLQEVEIALITARIQLKYATLARDRSDA